MSRCAVVFIAFMAHMAFIANVAFMANWKLGLFSLAGRHDVKLFCLMHMVAGRLDVKLFSQAGRHDVKLFCPMH